MVMAPTSTSKPKQVTFILSDEEHRMLGELAESDGRSAAGWLRMVIRREHARIASAAGGRGRGKR
jgi:hypothetical protein